MVRCRPRITLHHRCTCSMILLHVMCAGSSVRGGIGWQSPPAQRLASSAVLLHQLRNPRAIAPFFYGLAGAESVSGPVCVALRGGSCGVASLGVGDDDHDGQAKLDRSGMGTVIGGENGSVNTAAATTATDADSDADADADADIATADIATAAAASRRRGRRNQTIVERARNETQDKLDHELIGASRHGDAAAITSLIARGANANASNSRRISRTSFPYDFYSWSCLHFAASFGHAECIRRLCKHGADVNAATRGHGWTPLHFASHAGHDDAVVQLLIARANASSPTGQGSNSSTAMHLAASNAHGNVLMSLSGYGASLTLLDAREMTPLDVALERGHEETANLLIHLEESNKIWPGMERKVGPEGATFHADEPKYGEYTQKDGDVLSCATPPGESELDITQDGGFSTEGSEYSDFASAVGRHKLREYETSDSGFSQGRIRELKGGPESSESLTDAGDGRMVPDCVKYNRCHPSANRLWGRYQEMMESLVPESQGPTRSDLDPSNSQRGLLWTHDDQSPDGWQGGDELSSEGDEVGRGDCKPGAVEASCDSDHVSGERSCVEEDSVEDVVVEPFTIRRKPAKAKVVEDFWAEKIASFCIDDEPKIEHDEEQGEGSECVQVNQMLK